MKARLLVDVTEVEVSPQQTVQQIIDCKMATITSTSATTSRILVVMINIPVQIPLPTTAISEDND